MRMTMWRRHSIFSLALATAIVVVAAGTAEAQALRGSTRTTTRYIELQPIRQDTVSRDRVTERPDGGLEFEGFPVSCLPDDFCVFYRAAPQQSATVLYQDAEFTAWGLGLQGLSATALVRGRARLGGEFAPPRADDAFDAVLAYLELNRESYRVRLGRQRVMSGLGFNGFDGVDVLLQPERWGWLRLQGYTGRSLARGLSEPRQQALRGLDDAFFLSPHQAILAGTEVGVDPAPGTSLALRYQFEVWADRCGMLSERASLIGRTMHWRPLTLSGNADYDFAFGRIGKAQLTAQLPVARNRVLLEATARRHVPYFELWTIWGFFSPVGHHEGLLRTTWRASPALSVWGSAGYREYEDTGTDVLFDPLRSEAMRAELGGAWQLPRDLSLNGSYRWEGPVGAFLTSGDATLSWQPTDQLGIALNAVAFEQAEEFRIGSGRVIGGGAAVDYEIRDGMRLSGGLDVYRHNYRNRPSQVDWNQARGWMALQVGFGRDPGINRQVAP
jgi:hypothetical protein